MQFIKYCMLFFIFIFSSLIGKYISIKYKYRLEELEEFKSTLNILKNKIKFTYEPIPEIFAEIAKDSSSNISNLYNNAKEKINNRFTASRAWEESVDEYVGNIKKEDKQYIKTLSKLLRSNRYRRATKSNRNNRKFLRKSNKRCNGRKK